MPKAPRFIRAYEMLEIVIRTQRGVRLLRPTAALTAALLGVLARSSSMFEIWLHAFTFLSNHGHLQLTVRNAEHYAGFMSHFLGNSARAIQAVTGWEGPVWAASPRPIAILDDLSSLRRLKYVMSNGVKEGLVEHPLDWPGASGAAAMFDATPIVARWPLGGRHDSSLIELAPLPCWRDLAPRDLRQRLTTLVDEIVREGAAARAGRPCLGVPALLAQDPFEPTPLERERAPAAHAASRSTLDAYLAERDAFFAEYYASSPQMRRAPIPVPFPAGAFPPAPAFTRGV